MQSNNVIDNMLQEENHPSAYREVKIGKTYYCVTSVYTGEKELGPTLEKLAVQKVLSDMDTRAKEILRNG